jgi:iron(III) transport system ATP-binding protein
VISISGLCKTFRTGDDAVAALRAIELEVGRGEFFVLLGPSGSGKTTLLRSVAGLEKPDEGEISLNGKIVYSRSRRICTAPEEREIGMVFQSYAIWPHLTVAENIGLVLTHGRSRLSKKNAAERIRRSLALVQLDNFGDRPARLLSGGQQQRVALARALAVNPALLLMDEPLSNLDARLREEVRGNIKKLATQLGMTVLYVTHDQVEAMVLADRIAVMAQGEILQIGNPFELYRSPASALVAEFFGSINWMRGKMLDQNHAETECGVLCVTDGRRCEGAVIVGIRPEDVRLGRSSNEDENRIEGKIVSSTFLGDQVVTEVKINEKTLIAKVSPDDRPEGNTAVHLARSKLVVFPDPAGSCPNELKNQTAERRNDYGRQHES